MTDHTTGEVQKIPKRYSKVKNKAPAEVQITAEQLLREAYDRRPERIKPPPRRLPGDADDNEGLKLGKRREFEDKIRKNRANIINWFKYARFEEGIGELDRARSVFERALELNFRNLTVWLKYAEMEMRHKQINHARNIWDRAVLILPRVNQFWYKYTYMEELLGNVAGARSVFERWMEWQPPEQAWLSFIKMELRYKEVNRARAIYERFVVVHSDITNWVRFAKFEQKFANNKNARIVYEKAIEFYSQTGLNSKLMLAFAKFEEQCGEMERSRLIYKYAIENLPEDDVHVMIEEYGRYEKRHGDSGEIEDVIVTKRKNLYEKQLDENQYDYNLWVNLLRLLENEEFPVSTVRECYEKAISNVPPIQEKKHWRRYIYLWIMYAVYEELVAKDIERAQKVYRTCLDIIPHKKFTFAKVWELAGNFTLRQSEYANFRKLMGNALGMCPKNKLFKVYINSEFQMREFNRCRKLYDKFLEFNPNCCGTWIQYAEMETSLNNLERARGLYQLCINQPQLSMPEVAWKSFIDFEINSGEFQNARNLYEQLLERSQHVKIWINYAKFELHLEDENNVSNARSVFERAASFYKENYKTNDEYVTLRISLLRAWDDFEKNYGTESEQQKVKKLLPKKIKKRRRILENTGNDDELDFGWEEYYEYNFPEDIEKQANFKLLQMAYKWSQQKEATNDS